MSKEPIVERREYLRALEREWPEAVEEFDGSIASLYNPVLYKRRLRSKSKWAETDSLSMLRADPARAHWLKDLEGWARRYGILVDWILEAAVATCFWHHWPSDVPPATLKRIDDDEYFYYAPSAVFSAPFEPKIQNGVWLPPAWGGSETWPEFKKRVSVQLDEQLRQYGSVFGVDREHIVRDASWTVRYQRGQSAFEISEELTGYKDAEQTAYRAIQRFATIIGLHLRRNRNRNQFY